MAFRSGEASDRGTPIGEGNQMPVAAPQQEQEALGPSAPSAAYDPNSPEFRSLPRSIQKQVESGQIDMTAAAGMAQAAGANPGTSPVPQASPTTSSAQLDNRVPQSLTPSVVPSSSGVFSGAENRLTLGQALGGGRMGVDTFARKGAEAYNPFRGQEFGSGLNASLGSEEGGAKLSAADAIRFGNAGRRFIQGGAGGKETMFLQDIMGRQPRAGITGNVSPFSASEEQELI